MRDLNFISRLNKGLGILLSASLFFAAFPVSAGGVPDPLSLYGSKHEFLVKRNGSVVGKHSVQFKKVDRNLIALTDFKVAVTLLGIPLYSFAYQSEGIWDQGKLTRLKVQVDDQGERKTHLLKSSKEGFLLNGQQLNKSQDLLLPTNHWNPVVLQQEQVFNTILGTLSKVRIQNRGVETVQVKNGRVNATRYEYSGDLMLDAWYDAEGRWVKLRFFAEDDSIIEYFCLTCKKVSNS